MCTHGHACGGVRRRRRRRRDGPLTSGLFCLRLVVACTRGDTRLELSSSSSRQRSIQAAALTRHALTPSVTTHGSACGQSSIRRSDLRLLASGSRLEAVESALILGPGPKMSRRTQASPRTPRTHARDVRSPQPDSRASLAVRYLGLVAVIVLEALEARQVPPVAPWSRPHGQGKRRGRYRVWRHGRDQSAERSWPCEACEATAGREMVQGLLGCARARAPSSRTSKTWTG